MPPLGIGQSDSIGYQRGKCLIFRQKCTILVQVNANESQIGVGRIVPVVWKQRKCCMEATSKTYTIVKGRVLSET